MASTDIAAVMRLSAQAFTLYRQTTPTSRALFLDTIAQHIEALGDALLEQASAETNLPIARLSGERARTTFQLRMFAAMLREGSWIEASIDHANTAKNPPAPDIRKMLVPLGPVVVFGASNFPFAYSTAGGDTASALATGCTVVVKAHPAHLKTSSMVAAAITKAIAQCQMPEHCFQHVTDGSFETGKALVQDEHTRAVGFTGSFSGGRALYDYAAARQHPIPVFAEMGSINPVLLLPDKLSKEAGLLATQYAASITLGMGQFCTNPGLLLAVKSEALTAFKTALASAIAQVQPAPMLHKGIIAAYRQKSQAALDTGCASLLQSGITPTGDMEPQLFITTVSGADFLQTPLLREEVFGPYSLLVECNDMAELMQCWAAVSGQLTTSLMGTDQDFTNYPDLVQSAMTYAGRVVFNGVPTGVEVCNSMVHGGPYPATTDSRFTAVGTAAVKRWLRPVAFQNCPSALLPAALRDENPDGIWRLVNQQWQR
jgi:NADP-dependent aldehyde dehydrogenase